MSLPEYPITRREIYLAKAAGQDVTLPEEDLTREEQYLREIAEGGGGGGAQADWSQTDTDAPDYIKNKPTLGTAAAKDSTNAVTENSTDLVESGAVKAAIDTAVSSVYKPAGSKAADEFITDLLIEANLGKVYNASTSGTTTENFVEGAGKAINIGDNVVIVDVGTANEASYKFDLLAGFVDLSGKADKVSSATNGDLAALDASGNLTDSGSKAADFIISGESSGESITLTDAANARLQGLKIYGKSELSQGSIISVGDNGLTVTCGSTTAALSSGLPLCGVPVTAGRDHNYTDENDQDWMVDIFDITGKKIAYTALIDLGSLTWERKNGASGVRYFTATPEIPIKQLPGTQNRIIYDLICTAGYTSDTGVNIYNGVTDKTISLAAGVISIYNSAYVGETADTFKTAVTGVKLLYIIETPVADNVSAQDKAALIGLRTASGSMNITNTESAYMEAAYLKNSDSGDAISRVVDLLQGTDIKVFTYTGTGTVNHSVTFPEIPTMVLAMFGQHTFSSNTWSVSSRPFVWGVRPVFVDWCAVGGTSNGNQMMPATYNGKEISFSGMTISDPGAALNAEGETYTVYYI